MQFPLIVHLLYYAIYAVSLISSIILLYFFLKIPTHGSKTCYVMMANIAFLDLMICTMSTLLIPRQVSVGVSIVFYPGGLCTLAGQFTCEVITSMWLTFLAQNIMALSISFAYRAYILYRGTIQIRYGVMLSVIPYFVSIPVLFLTIGGQVSGEEFDKILISAGLPLDGMRFGCKNLLDLSGFIVMAYVFYQTPFQIILMFYFKFKASRFLDGHENLSKQTKETHRQLIKVLTIQILLPVIHFLNVCLYILRQVGVIRIPELEYGTAMGIHLLSALSPGISLYNVKPFREALLAPIKSMTTRSSIHTAESYQEKRRSAEFIEPNKY